MVKRLITTVREMNNNLIEKYKGQLCLDAGGDLVRLIELDEDEDDYYYKCQTLNRKYEDNGYVRLSAVGWLIPLKGKLDDAEYEYLDNMFKLNWERRT